MPDYHVVIEGGEITVLAVPGDPLRVLYEFVEFTRRPGICHFEFRPIVPVMPPNGMLPKEITVHMIPKGETFPSDPSAVKALTRVYGLEPARMPDVLTPDIIPSIVVGVNTTPFTSAGGVDVDARWRAVVTYPG